MTLKRGTRPAPTTTTDAQGRYEFKELTNIVPGNYTIEFAQPAGRKLSAEGNDPSLFTGGKNGATGVYKLNAPIPGVDLTELNAYYQTKPSPESAFRGATVVNGKSVNPKSVDLSSVSSSSTVVAFTWQLLDEAQTVISSGEVPGSSGSLDIPSNLSDSSYQVVVTAVDLFGHTSDAVTASFLVDTTAPQLTSTVTSVSQSGSESTPPTDAAGWIALYGVAASDGDGVGVSPAGITVDASAVTTDPGTYSITFRAEDATGLAATPLVVTYTIPATAVPSLVIGNPSVNHEMGSALPDDAGWIDLFQVAATATPPASSIAEITVDASAVRANLEGDYAVSFFATDNLGTVSNVQSGTVSVHDTTGPSLVLGTPEVTVPRDGSQIAPDDTAAWIALFGATATDAGSGMPTTGTLGLTVDASAVNYAAAGSYPVYFTATDKSGVTSVTTGTVIIERADAPSVEFTIPSVSYEMGDAPLATTDEEWKSLFGAHATSAPGTSVTSLEVDASDIDYSKPGSYLVWFTVTDSDSTESRFFTTVVVEDSTAPVLTVGSEKQTFKKGDTKISDAAGWIALFEAKGHDDGSGMPSVQPYGITVDASAVNYNRAGLYEVIFTATDSSGNISKSVTVVYEVSFVDSAVDVPDPKPVVTPGAGAGTDTPGSGSANTGKAPLADTGKAQLANTGASSVGLPLAVGGSLFLIAAAATLLYARRARRRA